MFRIPILSDIADQVKKVASSSFLNSTVAGCVLVMRANGEVKAEEKNAMKKHIVEHDILKVFNNKDVESALDEYLSKCEVSAATGEASCLEQVARVKGKTAEANLLVSTCIAIGAADGDFDDNEKEATRKVCLALGIDPSSFEL